MRKLLLTRRNGSHGVIVNVRMTDTSYLFYLFLTDVEAQSVIEASSVAFNRTPFRAAEYATYATWRHQTSKCMENELFMAATRRMLPLPYHSL